MKDKKSNKKHRIKIAFPAIIMIVTPILFGKLRISLAILASAALHELGHLIAASYFDVELNCFSLDLMGARLHTSTRLIPYESEAILCLCGPAMNFLSCVMILPFILKGYEISFFIKYFFASSLLLGTINMLPVSSFDGGRVLSCVLCKFFTPSSVSKITSFTSFVCIFCLWSMSVYILLRQGATLTLFVFSFSLFTRTFVPKE